MSLKTSHNNILHAFIYYCAGMEKVTRKGRLLVHLHFSPTLFCTNSSSSMRPSSSRSWNLNKASAFRRPTATLIKHSMPFSCTTTDSSTYSPFAVNVNSFGETTMGSFSSYSILTCRYEIHNAHNAYTCNRSPPLPGYFLILAYLSVCLLLKFRLFLLL